MEGVWRLVVGRREELCMRLRMMDGKGDSPDEGIPGWGIASALARMKW